MPMPYSSLRRSRSRSGPRWSRSRCVGARALGRHVLVFTLHNEKRGPATISKPTFDHNRVTFEYHDRNALDTFVRRSANPASASAKTFLSVRSGELHAAGGCTDDDSSLDGDDVGNDHPLAVAIPPGRWPSSARDRVTVSARLAGAAESYRSSHTETARSRMRWQRRRSAKRGEAAELRVDQDAHTIVQWILVKWRPRYIEAARDA